MTVTTMETAASAGMPDATNTTNNSTAAAAAADSEPQEEPEEEDDYQVDPIISTKTMRRPKRLSIPELLALRQEFGVSPLSLPPFARPRNIMTSTLSSKIAWNPTRLQNMMLAVGPGTPAAIVDLSVEQTLAAAATMAAARGEEDSSSESSSSSEDESFSDESGEEEEPAWGATTATATATTTATVTPAEPRTTTSAGSSSASSDFIASTTNPKRTLSDRMKMPRDDEDEPPQQQQESTATAPVATRPLQHDMALETATTTTSDTSGNRGKVVKNPPSGAAADPSKDADNDEDMEGYSDVEKELTMEDDKIKDDRGDDKAETGDKKEECEELTAREHFYLQVNHAEERRMQFSSNDEGDDSEDDEDEVGPQPRSSRGQWERTEEDGAEEKDDDEEEDDEDDEEMADYREMAAEWFAIEQAQAEEEQDDSESDGADDDGDSDDEAAALIVIRPRIRRRSPSPVRRNNNQQKAMKPSVRHAGCINTATWMDAGWRLSTVSSHHYSTSYNANYYDGDDGFSCHAMSSDDCPTQLVTSGDDRQVKFWDVRHAMGSANPLPWGRNTHCPFANTDDHPGGPGYKARWRDFYHKRKPIEPCNMFGNVLPLASLHTEHRGNVFHVTPLWRQPGKVATCGADGYLRLGDVEASSNGVANSSSIIISPEHFDDGFDPMVNAFFGLRPPMCFSHHFLNSNVGLLCSEKGLRKFDIRLPPRQQERRAVLGGNTACKSVAIWDVSSTGSVEEVDSSYVFVGGTGAEVALCDLRMTGGDSSSENGRVVCQYRPKSLHGNEEVSVSGLDLSRDKTELLVSYESDQIYTFPIFPNAKSAAGPSLEEIGGLEDVMEDGVTNGDVSMTNGRPSGEAIYQNELASYGGHLNRFTFLKNAKYAGPNDEYICTGSDSGHAWIYERSTGAVVSLLNADNSTCNGVVPHPSLPFFITYGIDSTAKLWRGTGPVDPTADDSPSGRAKAFNDSPYEMSPLTRDWDTVEHEISNMEQELAEADAIREEENDEDSDSPRKSLSQAYNILPDQVLSRKEVNSGSLGRSILRRFYSSGGCAGSRIGNDLHSLPDVLRRNQYECLRGAIGGGVGRRSDLPVESDMHELMRRVSLIRLRHQADRLGIAGRWKPDIPWILGADLPSDSTAIEGDEEDAEKGSIHPADLVPENPSDWIPYDPEMARSARPCGVAFNCKEYGDFYRERYLHSDGSCPHSDGSDDGDDDKVPAGETSDRDTSASDNAYNILHETARVLKDGGNEALRTGQLDVAAKRYDKAIRYCAVVFMSRNAASTYGGQYEDELMLISMKMLELDIESDHTVTPLMLKWSPLLKVLISTRLNLSMLLLKQAKHQSDVPQLDQAMEQARHALRELQPFCTQTGKICVTYWKSGSGGRLCTTPGAITSCGKVKKTKTEVLKSKEPDETYQEAKTLEAKAYFRLGSAQSDRGGHSEAVKSFEKSIECTLELNPDAKLDILVVRRLAEAKREKIRQNNRRRKKFRRMLAQEEDSAGPKAAQGVNPKVSTPADAGCKKDSRRRTIPLPVVSPTTSTPASSGARTPAAEDRGTQSE